MVTTILTKNGGFFLGPIANLLGLIMNGIYEFFSIFGIQNIAISIILFTFITKTLMLPLTIKQQKFTKLSAKMNPELQKIQAKYKGKKDEASVKKQQAETQAIYQKYGASPTSGCLPMLITLPIMFALYRVINNIPAYVNSVRELYEVIAIAIKNSEYITPMTEFAEAVGVRNINATDGITNNHIIDILARFQTEHWNQLMEIFPEAQQVISQNLVQIQNVNRFFGLNIAYPPGWGFPGIIIPILAMGLQFIQSKQLEVKNKANVKTDAPNPMASMNVVMPIMSGVFTVMLPIGVGIYWIATSVFAIIQQLFVNKYMDKIDVDELIEKSVAKANRKNIARAERTGTTLNDIARKQTKSIESNVAEKVNSLEQTDNGKNEDVNSESVKGKKESSYNPNSISDIANLLKNRNSEKGDK